jgi:hypothetical protein
MSHLLMLLEVLISIVIVSCKGTNNKTDTVTLTLNCMNALLKKKSHHSEKKRYLDWKKPDSGQSTN